MCSLSLSLALALSLSLSLVVLALTSASTPSLLQNPILTCLLPVLFIWGSGPLTRRVGDLRAQLVHWAQFTGVERAEALASREAARIAKEAARRERVIAFAKELGVAPPVLDGVVVASEGDAQEEGSEEDEQIEVNEVERHMMAEEVRGGGEETEEVPQHEVMAEEPFGEEETADAQDERAAEDEAEHVEEENEEEMGHVGIDVEEEEESSEESSEEGEEEKEESDDVEEEDDLASASALTLGGGMRRFDVRHGYFVNVSGRVMRLRTDPHYGLAVSPHEFRIRPGDTVRAEERSGTFIRVAGTWGKGWLPIASSSGAVLLIRRPAAEVLIRCDFAEQAAAPVPFERELVPILDSDNNEDAVAYLFRALEALCPESGIGCDVIDLAMPSWWSPPQVASFVKKYDADHDGKLSFDEFRAAYDELRSNWRFGSFFGAFSRADLDRDGVLNAEELVALLPLTVGRADAPQWLAKFDRSGMHGFLTLADYSAFIGIVRSDDMRSIICTSITMSIFLTVNPVVACAMIVAAGQVLIRCSPPPPHPPSFSCALSPVHQNREGRDVNVFN